MTVRGIGTILDIQRRWRKVYNSNSLANVKYLLLGIPVAAGEQKNIFGHRCGCKKFIDSKQTDAMIKYTHQ